MSHTVKRTPDGKYAVQLQEAPANCRALKMAPSSIEPELAGGPWVVLLVAVWSAPDLAAIREAVSLARDHADVGFGIRPFEEHRENQVWCPQVEEQFQSPIWIFLQDGVKIHEVVGLRPLKELAKCVQSLAKQATPLTR